MAKKEEKKIEEKKAPDKKAEKKEEKKTPKAKAVEVPKLSDEVFKKDDIIELEGMSFKVVVSSGVHLHLKRCDKEGFDLK